MSSAVPSARTSSAVLPKASALVCAKKLARNRPCTSTPPSRQRVRRVGDGDEVGGDEPRALVDELVERVLAVGAGLAPEHLAGLRGHGRAVPADRLAVGLHGQLLQVRREAVQVLGVREHRVRVRAEEVDVPDVQQAHEDGHVLRERRRRDVLVDRVEAGEELAERVRADRRWPARCRSSSRRSSGRPPSPRSRTRWRGRCRTRRPCRGRWTRRRSASRRRRCATSSSSAVPSVLPEPGRGPGARWSASPGCRTSWTRR